MSLRLIQVISKHRTLYIEIWWSEKILLEIRMSREFYRWCLKGVMWEKYLQRRHRLNSKIYYWGNNPTTTTIPNIKEVKKSMFQISQVFCHNILFEVWIIPNTSLEHYCAVWGLVWSQVMVWVSSMQKNKCLGSIMMKLNQEEKNNRWQGNFQFK